MFSTWDEIQNDAWRAAWCAIHPTINANDAFMALPLAAHVHVFIEWIVTANEYNADATFDIAFDDIRDAEVCDVADDVT